MASGPASATGIVGPNKVSYFISQFNQEFLYYTSNKKILSCKINTIVVIDTIVNVDMFLIIFLSVNKSSDISLLFTKIILKLDAIHLIH